MTTATLVFLGTGTSHGVPTIACDCPVCTSSDPHNNRLRTSALIEVSGLSFVFDTSIDFRAQALREKVRRLDAVFFTHSHADHIFGLDEVRRFNHIQREPVLCYAEADTVRDIRRVFTYIFDPPEQVGGGIPRVELSELRIGEPVQLSGIEFLPLRVWHGRLPISGYRVGRMGYFTDCSALPEETIDALEGLEVLVLGALRRRPHATHFNLEQAVEAARRIGAQKTYFVHMSHDLDHESTNATLPAGMALAHDGLRVEFEADR